MDLSLLRDRTGLTELAVLFTLHQEPGSSLTQVANALGITVQAVSNYVKAMAEQGLVEPSPNHPLTRKGIELLHQRMEKVKRVVDAAYARLSVITETAAVAVEPIRAGDRVGLFMEDGRQVAYPNRPSSSTGVAVTAAGPGEVVYISELDGIVEITPGRLHVVKVPVPPAMPRVHSFIKKHRLTARRAAGVGTEAELAARAMGLPLLEFAPVIAAFEAAQLGLDVILFATPDRVREVVAILDEKNEGALIPVAYQLHEVT